MARVEMMFDACEGRIAVVSVEPDEAGSEDDRLGILSPMDQVDLSALLMLASTSMEDGLFKAEAMH